MGQRFRVGAYYNNSQLRSRHGDANMKLPDILAAYSKADRMTAVTTAAFLIVTIAFADLRFTPAVSLGFLYLLPMLITALFVSRLELLSLAITCTLLREAFGPFEWGWGVLVRSVLGLLAFFGSGLFVEELARRRQSALEHLFEVEEQVKLRQDAEDQLRVLIETSPAAILTVDAEGKIQLANQAAHQLLASDQQPLGGEPVGSYLPLLTGVPQADRGGRILRTTLECKGRRRNGDVFPAHVWLSTFMTPSGPRLAAIIMDTSEELRDREELGFDRLMASSRILVRAVSHEIRNLCAAIAVVHANLSRTPGLAKNEDYLALGTLAEGLGRLVSTELKTGSQNRVATVNLREVLEELRIVIEPSFDEQEATVKWRIPEDLPPVCADRQGLLHVFMNLTSNSHRAIRGMHQKELAIQASVEADRVVIRFTDTGHGVRKPDQLFQPFQQGADGAGLGLYLSRALVRSFAGELRHQPQRYGSCFSVELAPARQAGATLS
jgi:PAS domain S-box-containing protein